MTGYPKNPPAHEAGHAVVAYHLYGERGKVRARVSHRGPGQRWYGGDCQYESPPRRRHDLEPMRQELAVLVAGSVADYIAAGRGHDELDPVRILHRETAPHARRDGSQAPDAHAWAVEQLAEEYRDEAMAHEILDGVLAPDALRRANRIIRAKWLMVEKVARELETGVEVAI